jgi:isoquinoline 1-oxidoreductase alpha subunit
MASFQIHVNGRTHRIDADPATPLLWILRDQLGLMGTKYGCGQGVCGSCTVLQDGKAIRSCQLPLGQVGPSAITTIEGLAKDHSHPLQKAWLEEDVPQCGYCQPGMIMAAAGLLKKKPKPTDADIDEAMAGMVCRCGTYGRIRRAIHRAAQGVKP